MKQLSTSDRAQGTGVHDRLVEALRRSDMSIRKLQRALSEGDVPGSGYASVHSYVKGGTEPRRDWLAVAAGVLGVRLEWLADGDGEMTAEDAALALQATVEREATSLPRELALHVDVGDILTPYRLPPEVRQAIYGYIWRRFDLTRKGQELEGLSDQAEHDERHEALRDEIDVFVAEKLRPALLAQGLPRSQYAATLFAQLSILYLTDPPHGPQEASQT